MGFFMIGVGLIVNIVTGVMILVKAFRVRVLWGLAYMFVPFASLIFVIKNWEDTKKPFLIGLAGIVVILLGVGIVPDTPSDASVETAANSPTPAASETETPASYASAAPSAAPVQPASSSYTPSYTPSYQPPAAPPPTTETQAPEDEWARKATLEQVYVDRDKNVYYSEQCKKRPENVYRLAKTLAIRQGMVEAKCR